MSIGPKSTDVHISCVIMMKNESKRIHVTINSVIPACKSIVVYDTGSEDNCIEIVKNIADKAGTIVRLKQDFIPKEKFNFRDPRNTLQDFADTFTDIDYYLLMDCNDQLQNPKELLRFCNEMKDKEHIGFLLKQEWFSGNMDSYWNIRLVRARTGWRYKQRVHEYPTRIHIEPDDVAPQVYRVDFPGHPVLYQDRTQDDDKTGKRFVNDKRLLLEDYEEDPSDQRVVFYLAQTCSCLDQIDESFYYYKLRAEMDGFWEEKFHALNRCGELAGRLGHPWKDCMSWFMQALEVSPRVEPLIEITKHYIQEKNWLLAFTFCDLACKLTYPEYTLLFVNKKLYDYDRWHLMGTIGHNVGYLNEGKSACIRALESEKFKHPLDAENLKKYQEKEREKENAQIQNLTKQQFIDKTCAEVILQNPRMNKRDMEAKASVLWKLKTQQIERERKEKEERERLEKERLRNEELQKAKRKKKGKK
jgi:glycosyltransferase involved in cell wall biosynthesis